MFDPRRHAVRPDLADIRLAELLPEDHPVVDGALEQVIAPVVPIFAHPSGTAERASEALLGERVMVFEDREGFSWCQLETDGYVGYIPTAALSPEMSSQRTGSAHCGRLCTAIRTSNPLCQRPCSWGRTWRFLQ